MTSYSADEVARLIDGFEKRIRKLERGNGLARSSAPVWIDEDTVVNLDVPSSLFIGVEAGVDAQAALDQLALLEPPDGVPPASSPAPVVNGMIGSLHVNWEAVLNASIVTYQVHISVVSGFTPDASTLVAETMSTSITIHTLPTDLDLEYDVLYYVKIIATDVDGAASPSAEGSAEIMRAEQGDISANYVYAGEISANQITGGTIAGDVVVGGSLRTNDAGARGELDAGGLTLYGPDGIPTTDLSTDGQSVFKGDAEINGLTVKSTMSIRGMANELSSGSILELAEAITAPSTAPTVVQTWDSQIFTKVGDAAFNPVNLTSVCWVGAYWVCGYDAGSTYAIYKFNADGTFHSTVLAPYPTTLNNVSTQIVDGGPVYTMKSTGVLVKHGDPETAVTYARLTPSQHPALGNDGTNLLVAEYVIASNTIRIQTVNATTLAVMSTVTTNSVGGFNGPLVAVMKDDFDFGASRYVVKAIGNDYWWVFTHSGSSATYQVNEAFPYDNGGSKGATWDGANFWGLGTDGKLYQHTVINPAGVPGVTPWCAAFTWYDSNATGGTHETTISPVASFSLKKRAKITVTSPAIPPGGDVDDIDSIRIYMGATAGTLTLQSTLAPGLTSAVYPTLVVGASPPVAGDFPAATPALIRNASSSLVISGDGTIVVDQITITGDDTGWISVIASVAVAQTGWSIDAASIRRIGKTCHFVISVARTGADLAAPQSQSNIASAPIAQMVAAYRPGTGSPDQAIASSGNRVVGGCIGATGIITLESAAGTAVIATDDTLSVGGSYLLI